MYQLNIFKSIIIMFCPWTTEMATWMLFISFSTTVCTIGCSDFDFFHILRYITTHPWHPKGPRIWKLAKKNFQLHPWPAEIFGKNQKMLFFGLVSKFNFRSLVWQIFTIFSACLFMESLIHIPNLRSLSQKLQSQENGQDRVQNLSVCKIWEVNFI